MIWVNEVQTKMEGEAFFHKRVTELCGDFRRFRKIWEKRASRFVEFKNRRALPVIEEFADWGKTNVQREMNGLIFPPESRHSSVGRAADL